MLRAERHFESSHDEMRAPRPFLLVLSLPPAISRAQVHGGTGQLGEDARWAPAMALSAELPITGSHRARLRSPVVHVHQSNYRISEDHQLSSSLFRVALRAKLDLRGGIPCCCSACVQAALAAREATSSLPHLPSM